ncbi:unnamed protein product [Discosporangium mesarthrocarpum]
MRGKVPKPTKSQRNQRWISSKTSSLSRCGAMGTAILFLLVWDVDAFLAAPVRGPVVDNVIRRGRLEGVTSYVIPAGARTLHPGKLNSAVDAEGEERGTLGGAEKVTDDWGLGDEVDTREIRLQLMRESGINVDEEGADPVGELGIDDDPQALEKVAEKIRNAMVTDLVGDQDMNKLLSDELEKGVESLRALGEELKLDQGNSSTAEAYAQDFANKYRAASETVLTEYEGRAGRLMDKLLREKKEVETAAEQLEEARSRLARDPVLMLRSFPQRGRPKQAAFVLAIIVANQASYQLLLLAEGRGGSGMAAFVELVVSAGLLWFYGFRLPG